MRHPPTSVGVESRFERRQHFQSTNPRVNGLDPSINNPSLLCDYLKPFDPALMKKYPVSTRVNRPENDDHECAQEVPLAVTPTLF